MPDPDATWFERNPRKTLTAVIATAFFLMDLVAGYFFVPDYVYLRTPHHYYHHDFIPNRKANLEWGDEVYPVFTNSLGFRDKNVRDVGKRSSLRRILLMGDSFTEGVGVRFEESFAGLLSHNLEKAGIEVLNAAVIGYSPKLYYLKTRHLIENDLLDFDEMFVFIDMSDIPNELVYEGFEPKVNDTVSNIWFRTSRFLRNKSYVFFALSRILQDQANPTRLNPHGIPFTTDAENLPFDDPGFRDPQYWNEEYKYASAGLEIARSHMEELVRLCKEHDIRVTLVVYPWPKVIFRRELDHIQVRFWRDFCDRNRIDFVDLFPVFINEMPAKTVYEKYFIQGDIHWNREGNVLVASALYDYLSRRTYVDSLDH